MPSSITRSTDVVTSTSHVTFVDLFSMDYDQFKVELDQMHGHMQCAAIKSTVNTYTRFEGLMWWYCISQTLSSCENTNPLWYPLHEPRAYQSMLNTLSNSLGTENIMLELTNNLEYIDSAMTLPASKYPTTTVDHQDEPAIVYPAYITMKQAARVRFPPASSTTQTDIYKPSPQAYDTLNCLQLDEFNYGFPAGLNLQSAAVIPTPPSHPRSPALATLRPQPPLALPTPSNLLATPLSYHVLPMTALPTPSTLPTTSIRPYSSCCSPSPSLTQAHESHKPTHSHSRNRKVSFSLLRRPPTHITRRYSLPFDRHTMGVSHPTELYTLPKTRVSSGSTDGVDLGFTFTHTTRTDSRLMFGEAPYVTPGSSIFWGLDRCREIRRKDA